MAAASPAFAKWKRTYDISRTTVTRTSYEEDFGATLALLANQGVKFSPNAYMCVHALSSGGAKLECAVVDRRAADTRLACWAGPCSL